MLEKMKARGPFKYIRTNEDGGDTYEAEFRLADDGTPGSDRYLVVKVETEYHENRPLVSLYIKSNGKLLHVTSGPSSTKVASDLLYGAARLITVEKIEPL